MAKKEAPSNQPKLAVKIFSPFQTYYYGGAVSVSANNPSGPFDVLENHANFFALLSAGDVVVNTGFQSLKFPLTSGVIKVSDNQVTVFADI